ncbi:MAG: membrane protein insertase YidC [Bryobacteraceae bacterium]|nr:MAG: membrane protein insertase YidC [Bryobacteraceae bacterium]
MPDSSKKPAGSEMSMETRLLLAFGLMGLVLFASQYFLPKPAPPPQKKAEPVEVQVKVAGAEEQPAAPKAPAAAPAKAAAPAQQSPERIVAEKEETHILETSVYRIVFCNRGAVIRSWVLKKYRDSNGSPVELVNAIAAPKAGWAYSYVFPREKPAQDLNTALFAVSQPDPLTVEFRYDDGATRALKRFRFEQDRYRGQFFSEVASQGRPIEHHLAWRGGFGDRTVHNPTGVQKTVYYDAAKQKLVEEGVHSPDKGPITTSGAFHFAGIEDTYFAAVALPRGESGIEFTAWSDPVAETEGGEEKPHAGVSLGGRAVNEWMFFVGPKDTDILRSTDRKLETMIDWGWFWFIAKPLFLALHWIHDNWTQNWGWAIVIATVIINLLMLPLRLSQLKSSQKMAQIQPELQALQAKYKGLSMKDPKRQKMNEEMIALYQKHGINPMGGCLPLLLQMPFFIAFFKVLSVAIELRGAQWLWVTDLSQPEATVIRFLPIGMLVTQIILQKMTPVASPDPSQQRLMMVIMPVMLTVLFYSASSGLVLYWLTGNVVGIVQQYFFNKTAAKPSPAPAQAPKTK